MTHQMAMDAIKSIVYTLMGMNSASEGALEDISATLARALDKRNEPQR